MRMDLAGERFQVEERYEVRLPPGDHLIIVAGAHLGESGYDFDHPNIAAKKSELFQFKHYRQGGSKFWIAKAGISFYFAIPKAQIELLPEKGYSYVPVLIQGRKCHLNVSGGTGDNGWTDWVHQGVDIGCGWTIAALRSLATIALNPEDCRTQGITLAIEPLKDYQRSGFLEAAATAAMRPRLGVGVQVFLLATAGTTWVARDRSTLNPGLPGNGTSSAPARPHTFASSTRPSTGPRLPRSMA